MGGAATWRVCCARRAGSPALDGEVPARAGLPSRCSFPTSRGERRRRRAGRETKAAEEEEQSRARVVHRARGSLGQRRRATPGSGIHITCPLAAAQQPPYVRHLSRPSIALLRSNPITPAQSAPPGPKRPPCPSWQLLAATVVVAVAVAAARTHARTYARTRAGWPASANRAPAHSPGPAAPRTASSVFVTPALGARAPLYARVAPHTSCALHPPPTHLYTKPSRRPTADAKLPAISHFTSPRSPGGPRATARATGAHAHPVDRRNTIHSGTGTAEKGGRRDRRGGHGMYPCQRESALMARQCKAGCQLPRAYIVRRLLLLLPLIAASTMLARGQPAREACAARSVRHRGPAR